MPLEVASLLLLSLYDSRVLPDSKGCRDLQLRRNYGWVLQNSFPIKPRRHKAHHSTGVCAGSPTRASPQGVAFICQQRYECIYFIGIFQLKIYNPLFRENVHVEYVYIRSGIFWISTLCNLVGSNHVGKKLCRLWISKIFFYLISDLDFPLCCSGIIWHLKTTN